MANQRPARVVKVKVQKMELIRTPMLHKNETFLLSMLLFQNIDYSRIRIEQIRHGYSVRLRSESRAVFLHFTIKLSLLRYNKERHVVSPILIIFGLW